MGKNLFFIDTEYKRLILAMHAEDTSNSNKLKMIDIADKAVKDGCKVYGIENSTNGVKMGYKIVNKNGQVVTEYFRK